MTVIWIVASFNYYLITFYMKYVPGDIFINTSIGCFAEIFGDILSAVLLQWLGYKLAFIIAFLVAGVGGFCIGCVSTGGVGAPFFVIWAKFGISFAFNLGYLAMPLLFPVDITSTCLGVVNVFARFLTIISPVAAEWEEPTPMLLWTALCILAIIGTVFLRTPKEQGKALKPHLESQLLESKYNDEAEGDKVEEPLPSAESAHFAEPQGAIGAEF
jgi:hypothetical protein